MLARSNVAMGTLLFLLLLTGCGKSDLPNSRSSFYLTCGGYENLYILDYGEQISYRFNLLGRWVPKPMERFSNRFEFGGYQVSLENWQLSQINPGLFSETLQCKQISRIAMLRKVSGD
ncbi:MAG TPA: hypothetical protein DDZ38_09750 [Gammaproteobacteria bacterium]|nr:hypothetical protein [Gammaproteobacteria bacterium]